ncbi:MAG TPA: HupE/UreJ family protein [Candidatus Limnocylindrales bacterium]|nr:HupE/UreJ family protein [Candidatus Limnocylindrales bacterium]
MKLVVSILLMALMISIGFFEQSVKAHELIPKAVLEYVQNNPDATPEQIEAFDEQNSPEFSEATNGGADILRIAQNQDASLLDNSLDFIQLGIQHILSGPDHILFVLTLLLAFISIGKTLKLVTAFTLAHSITLILAGASILTLSSRIVEPLIALSISIMAVTTVFFKNNKYFGTIQAKAGIVFFFGLFHGLGFAGLLQEIQVPSDKFLSSLIAFNIGIEIGQIAIIMIALPFILLFKNKPWYNRLIQIFAGAIAVIGIVWAVQRALGF